jgi:hypothetical protein
LFWNLIFVFAKDRKLSSSWKRNWILKKYVLGC